MHNSKGNHLVILFIILSISTISTIFAQPPLPSSYYGNVSIDGTPASVGSEISAWINGINYPANFVVTTTGIYLIAVNGDDPSTTDVIEGGVNGDIVYFKVMINSGTYDANETGIWQSGINTPLDLSVITDGNDPIVITDFADNVTNSSARLRGSVNPNGSAATYKFQYGLTTDYGLETSERNLSSGTTAVEVNENIGSLTPGATYHFRLVASNTSGTSNGGDKSFITISTSPILNSPPNGSSNQPLTPTLNWNTVTGATSYGVQVAANPDFSPTILNISGITESQYTITLGNLTNNTTYYWRTNASNVSGTSSWSGYWSFTTSLGENTPPVITSSPLLTAVVGEEYEYDVNANDPDWHEVLTYSFTESPAFLSINSDNGLISGIPSANDLGNHNISILVTDLANDFDTQSYVLTVIDNNVDFRKQDSLALVALYNSTDGQNWTDNTNWLSSEHIDNWFGISISNDRVTGIDLELNNLVGYIPVHIGDLLYLEHLDLSRNNLTGSIPSEIGNLNILRILSVHQNNLTGSIPSSISNLSNLEILSLAINNLSGEIPVGIIKLNNLTLLSFAYNNLTGKIPVGIGELINLEILDLRYNSLSGDICEEIFVLTKLELLYIDHNNFTGVIPKAIGNLVNLQRLELDNNFLSGLVPSDITNLNSLHTLNISSNKLDDLPDLSVLPALIRLYVNDNRFTFEDIEPNITVPTYRYSPQSEVGTEETRTISSGATITLNVYVGGSANIYQWYKNGTIISNANQNIFAIANATSGDAGVYTCQITNSIASELTLYSKPITISVVTSIDDKITLVPDHHQLEQNFPNPFNPSTHIRYALPQSEHVKIEVFNTLGIKVKTLVDSKKMAGFHTIKFNAQDIPSGIYFYRFQAGEFQDVKKMILIR